MVPLSLLALKNVTDSVPEVEFSVEELAQNSALTTFAHAMFKHLVGQIPYKI